MNRNELADSVNALVERSMPVDVPGDAEYIAATVEACRGRFLGTGTKYQISEDEQSFERSSIGTMLKGKREELQDGVNYAVMLDVLAERNNDDLDADFILRLRQYCETVTCLLVDFDRELQEMLAALVTAGKYVETSGEYVETLAAEVNAKQAVGDDTVFTGWQVGVDSIFAVHEARASVALDGETQSDWSSVPIPLGAGDDVVERRQDVYAEANGEYIREA